MTRVGERVASWVHALHGSRGIYVASIGFLILTWVDPAIPADVDRLLLTLPIFVVFANGLATLPREGVAAKKRALTLLQTADWRPIARRLVWPALICLALAPKVFLAVYGIPHMSPLTGVLTPGLQRQVAVTFLFVVMLLPATYLRSSKRYAPDVVAQRPAELRTDDVTGRERDVLLVLSAIIAVIWAWLLAPFWAPFSLFEWMPSLDSLQLGARGVGSIAFALTIPLVLWMSLNAHIALVWQAWRKGDLEKRTSQITLAILHIILVVGAVVLHIYDLLWIAQYRSAVGF